MIRPRDLEWDGCLNVRDLGGHRTRHGRETRFGAIVRADSVRQLSPAGWRAAVEYGVRTIIDLRGEHEQQDDPPGSTPIDVVHAPFTANYASEWARLHPAFDQETDRRTVYLVVLEQFSRSVAGCVRAVAGAAEGGVVIHCVGGKDRTGLLAALLLDLAGVDLKAIATDYAISEARLRPREELWLAEAETEAERQVIRLRSRTPAEAMVGVLEELQRRYGSVEGYLREAGATESDFERVRARLLA
jgi:protein-tyrosine phosphatase